MTGPFLRYPGSKWRLADWICGHLPAHRIYLEPYVGSGAVFFSKRPAPVETINDLDGELVNLFMVVRETPEALARAVSLTPYSRAEHRAVWDVVATADPVERARRYLARIWMNHGMKTSRHGGWAHTRSAASAAGGCSSRVPAWNQIPERIMAAVERLRHAQIECRDALEVISDYARPDCLIYADPPYLLSTRGERQYQHEMEDAQHSDLLNALTAHPGPVVLSGYGSALYDERLIGWRRVATAALAEAGARRTEILWLNPVTVRRLERERSQATLLEVPA